MAAKKPAKTEKAAPVTGAQEEKLKALEHALADLDKQFGKGAVMKLGEHAEQNVQVIPTGCLTLDEALQRTCTIDWIVAIDSQTFLRCRRHSARPYCGDFRPGILR